MRRYDFVNINEMPSNSETLKTSFGGIVLDDLGAGFATLNVFGREVPLMRIKTTARTGADGEWLEEQSLAARKISVEASVDSDDLSGTTSLLMGALLKADQKLSFSDDDQYYYNAIFIGTNQPDRRSYQGVMRFEFLCLDPYKYHSTQDVVTGKWLAWNSLPNVPDELTVTLTANGGVGVPLKITNARSGKSIIIDTDSNFAIGDVVKITWGMIPAIKLNNVNHLAMLSIDGDFELFEISNNDELTITPASTYEMKIRKKYY